MDRILIQVSERDHVGSSKSMTHEHECLLWFLGTSINLQEHREARSARFDGVHGHRTWSENMSISTTTAIMPSTYHKGSRADP